MIVMEGSHRLYLEQMAAFVAASQQLEVVAANRDAARQLVAQVLEAQQYGSLSRAGEGTVREYLMRVTGYGRAQLTRLIGQFRLTGDLASPSRNRRNRFPYTLYAAGCPAACRY